MEGKGKNRKLSWCWCCYVLVIVLIAGAFITSYLLSLLAIDDDGGEEKVISLYYELKITALKLVKFSAEASTARMQSFNLLRKSQADFNSQLAQLNGAPGAGIPPLPDVLSAEYQALGKRWQEMDKQIETVIDAEATIRILKEYAHTINEIMPTVIVLTDEIIRDLLKAGAHPQAIFLSSRQLLLSQRMEASINKLLQGGEVSEQAKDQFSRDADILNKVWHGMLKGDKQLRLNRVSNTKIRKKLKEVVKKFTEAKEIVAKIIERSPMLYDAQNATNLIFTLSDGLSSDIELLFERHKFVMEENDLIRKIPKIFSQ